MGEPPRVVRRFHWRSFAFGVLLPLALAFFFGPKYTALSEDPLTGRRKHEVIWLGLNVYERTDDNEVSKWADQCSVPEIYPARFGWNVITQTNRGWFTGTTIGCGGGYRIPDMIFQGQIAIDGQTREETLQSYQNDSVEAYYLHGSTVGVQRRWAALHKPPTDDEQSDARETSAVSVLNGESTPRSP